MGIIIGILILLAISIAFIIRGIYMLRNKSIYAIELFALIAILWSGIIASTKLWFYGFYVLFFSGLNRNVLVGSGTVFFFAIIPCIIIIIILEKSGVLQIVPSKNLKYKSKLIPLFSVLEFLYSTGLLYLIFSGQLKS